MSDAATTRSSDLAGARAHALAGAAALAFALALPPPLASQQRAELEARLARLRADRAALDSTVAARQARELARRGWQVVRAGRLVVQYEAADARLVEGAIGKAWDELARQYGSLVESGDSVRLRLSRVTGTRRGDSLQPSARSLEVTRAVRARPGTMWTSPLLAPPIAVEELVSAMVRVAGEQVWNSVDSTLARWHPAVPATGLSTRQAVRAYVQLASSPFEGGRYCFAGELAACGRMLGLVPHLLDPVTSYTPQERREFAVRLARGYLPGSLSLTGKGCVDLGNMAACDTLLANRPGSNQPLIPLDLDARGLLLSMAMQAGGDGALARLVGHPEAPLADRLAASAGLPTDSLLARWHEVVMQARPKQVAVTAAGGWMAFGWSLVLFGLALGSSRWR